MLKNRDAWFVIIISLIVLCLISLPFILAARTSGTDHVFTGFLFNPIDGNTYLAKILQGWQGHWRFKLPYTAESGQGAYIYILYLGLGHLARILNLSNILVFHLARWLSVTFLLWTMWRYFGALFSTSRPRKFAFSLAALGSGMGWLLVASGSLTSDFWVAEAYPFLSSYANPHFPISLALMLWLLMPPLDCELRVWQFGLMSIAALVLGHLSPFGIVVVVIVAGSEFLRNLLQKVWLWNLFWRLLLIVLFSLPVILYALWAVTVDPVLAGWNVQNLTPSPPLWDLLVSFSPALILAVGGIWAVIRWRKQGSTQEPGSPDNWTPLILWIGLGFVLMYMPWGLQRRLIIGFYIPVAALAALALEFLASGGGRRYRNFVLIVLILAIPTNMIVLLAGFQAARTQDPKIYLSQEEYQALTWIVHNTEPDDLVLSSPEMGLFIPAFTGRQVIYGHPFETVDAENAEKAVTEFFSGEYAETQLQGFVKDRGVDYIFFGPREQTLGPILIHPSWKAAFQSSDVTIFIIE